MALNVVVRGFSGLNSGLTVKEEVPVILVFGLTVPLPAQSPDRLNRPIENYSLHASSFIAALLNIYA